MSPLGLVHTYEKFVLFEVVGSIWMSDRDKMRGKALTFFFISTGNSQSSVVRRRELKGTKNMVVIQRSGRADDMEKRRVYIIYDLFVRIWEATATWPGKHIFVSICRLIRAWSGGWCKTRQTGSPSPCAQRIRLAPGIASWSRVAWFSHEQRTRRQPRERDRER